MQFVPCLPDPVSGNVLFRYQLCCLFVFYGHCNKKENKTTDR